MAGYEKKTEKMIFFFIRKIWIKEEKTSLKSVCFIIKRGLGLGNHEVGLLALSNT